MKQMKRFIPCLMILLALLLLVPSQANAAVKISNKSITLTVGQKKTLKVKGTKKKPKWSSSKKSVATVTSKGKVTAKKKGNATITAKIAKKKYTCKVKVESPIISKKSMTLLVGNTSTLKMSGTSQKVTWKSSNKKIATVTSKGKVKGIKAGNCNITATVSGKKYFCKVKVESPEINKKSLTLYTGKTETLIISGTSQKVTWKSSDEKIATVTSKGKVKGIKAGKCTITATVSGKKYTCKVTVKNSLTINKTCIYNGNDISIYAMNINEKDDKYEIGVYIENRSQLNLGLNARAYSVNGVMTGNSIYAMDCDVSAGKKANTVLEIKKDFLKEKSIKEIEYVDILIWAYDNDKHFKSFDTGQLRIMTSTYKGERKDYASGKNVYNKDGIKIDFLKSDGNEYTFTVTNNTGTYLDYDVENININDFTVSKIDYDLIGVITLNGCQSEFTIKIDENFKNDNGISKINKVEFTLNVRPEEDYFKDYNTDVIIGV